MYGHYWLFSTLNLVIKQFDSSMISKQLAYLIFMICFEAMNEAYAVARGFIY